MGQRSAFIKVRVTPEEKAELAKRARMAGVTVSDLVRNGAGIVRGWDTPTPEAENRWDSGGGADGT